MAEKLIGGIRINDNSNFDVYADGTKPTGLINNVTGESIEGGGENNFSTASVTFINTATNPIMLTLPHTYDSEDGAGLESNTSVAPSGSLTIDVLLYKGLAAVNAFVIRSSGNYSQLTDGNFVATGDIEIDGEELLISGTGTVTISALE